MHALCSHIFFVDDVRAARDWYARVLGTEPYFDHPFYTGFDVGGYELGLHPSSESQRPGVGGDRAYWRVPEVESAWARLVELGATPLEPVQDVGGGIRLGAVRDPFGNAIGLITNPHFRAGVVEVVPHGCRLGAGPGDLSSRVLVREVVVRQPPSAVWPLWTTSAGLGRWLGASARIELRIGGPFEVSFLMDQPEGSRGSEGCRVLSWLPERMLSFTWNAPPHLPSTRPQHTWVVVELLPEAEGTRVRLSHLGWPASGLAEADGDWQKTWSFFEGAWSQALDGLGRLS